MATQENEQTGGTGRRALLGAAVLGAGGAVLGLSGTALMGPGYGIWSQHLVALWGTGTLVVFTSAALTAALESWVGLVGTGLAMLLLFVIGNPGSGGVYPPEFLPGFFRDLHRWLPTGQATELVRAVEYFGGHATGAPIFGLVSYLTIGLILLLAATYALGHRHSRPSG